MNWHLINFLTGEGNGNLLQYSCLENPMDRGAWQAACSPWGHKELGVTERLTLSHFHTSLTSNTVFNSQLHSLIKPTFSLSYFTFIKRLFSSSSLSAIRIVSSAYLRLLIFLPAILIPACASSSPAFLMVYSAYKLNKQGDNIQF